MTTREIQAHLREIYGTEVAPELISSVTVEVIEEVRAWHSRPLSECSPILYLDALFVRTKQGGPARPKAVNIVVGVRLDGRKEGGANARHLDQRDRGCARSGAGC